MKRGPHYCKSDLVKALRAVGVRAGDSVFSHSNVGYFGFPEEGQTAEAIFQTILGAFQDVIGEEGTLVVPTFTYSFCKGEPFDADNTPSTCGIFTEMLRQYPGARRSHDPIFSVAALGSKAEEFTNNVAVECFGPNSFWHRFLEADGIICNLNYDTASNFIHYIERCLNVPYRYDKLFTGTFIRNGQSSKGSAIYFCQDLSNSDTTCAAETFDKLARDCGLARSIPVGRGAVVSIKVSDVYKLIEDEFRRNPWWLTTAAKEGRAPVLIQPADTARFALTLSKNASMEEMIEALWALPRDILSDGYDAALEALAKQVPMTVHEYPTGTHCWTWIIPEKWTCHEAYLETLDGRRLFSYADNPLHVVSYSLPFEGEISREELFAHLHVHPNIPDAVPFKFKYYEQDWGLCCSQDLRDSLTDEQYRVVIKTSFSYDTLKVGEVVVPGEKKESIVLCAHLCHPAMVNDDLTGVVVGIKVMRELMKRRNLRYTYRLLIVPETIGSIAYLSHHEELIPEMKGALFLEILGLENPHALQLSFAGITELDLCFNLAVKDRDRASWTGAFGTVIGNDERQFNSPGVRVPMLSLSRVLLPSEPDWPYREYHSSHDTPELCSLKSLEDSRDLVLKMIDTLEANLVPVNRFRGEVFCSRYGLDIDFYTDREAHQRFFDIMYQIDGTRSIAQIASKCNVSFWIVKQTIDDLHRHGLVEYTDQSEK